MPATTKELAGWWSRRDDHAKHRRAELDRSTRAAQGRARHRVNDLGALTWAKDTRTCPPWMHADGLSASQRLLLNVVLGPDTYRQAADQSGLTPTQVSQRRPAARALRQLATAGHRAEGAVWA